MSDKTDITKTNVSLVQRALKQEAKIGQILLTQTSLTEAQLKEALQIQKEKGGRLGEILVQRKRSCWPWAFSLAFPV